MKDLDEQEAIVEVEEDTFVKKDAVPRATEPKKEPVPPQDKEEIMQKVLKGGKRFNQMQKIPAGTFIMGTDEMITRDGEMPSRK